MPFLIRFIFALIIPFIWIGVLFWFGRTMPVTQALAPTVAVLFFQVLIGLWPEKSYSIQK